MLPGLGGGRGVGRERTLKLKYLLVTGQLRPDRPDDQRTEDYDRAMPRPGNNRVK